MASFKSILSTSAKAVDPSLDALFSSSIKPAEPGKKQKYADLMTTKARSAPTSKSAQEEDEDDKDDEDDEDDEEETEESEDNENEMDGINDEEEKMPVETKHNLGKRKRKARDETEGLESRYLDKIAAESAPAEKRSRRMENLEQKDSEENEDTDADESVDEPIVHESILPKEGSMETKAAGDDGNRATDAERDKAARTVFLSNVSIEAVTSRAAKKTLLAHLALPVVGKREPGVAIESLRFRSVPFATAALPKRAAYITKAVMDATAHATNAYAVYATAAGARQAVRQLNGSVVLGRHLRADSVAHPAAVDHRRCVFVGNLGFMDDEVMGGEDGEEAKRRFKVPMDVEEGLWRTFGQHAGPVESVRVVRDPATRVGKGFAYVQFVDGTSVEAALLLAGRAFPPMLPRPLRVSRCKAPQKTALAIERAQKVSAARQDARRRTHYVPKPSAEQQTEAGRVAKLLGRSATKTGKPKMHGPASDSTEKQAPVFEGMRAKVGQGGLGKKGKGGHKGKGDQLSNNEKRRAKRAASWKAKK